MIIRLRDHDGKNVKWFVTKEKSKPSFWILTDSYGYERILDNVWATSIPRIKLIAENHGLTLLHEIS